MAQDKDKSGPIEVDLFDGLPAAPVGGLLPWPPQDRFPLNLDARRVDQAVRGDLQASPAPLIVTGYASLDRLIDFLSSLPERATPRVLLGQEPFASRRETFEMSRHGFAREVADYWLEQGISVLLSARLITCIERLKAGRISTRYLADSGHRLHAKLYCGEAGVTLGSSNFTEPGLRYNREANVRFTLARERKRFEETWAIAENYWALGRDYNDELIALLEQLLRVVPWREAIARACAELLEGDWAERYLREDPYSQASKLWPSQRQGIAQALFILARQDSVLIADATGAGKTRMGAHLIAAVWGQILRSGRMRREQALMVCPPAVKASWDDEAMRAGLHLETFSHGALSHSKSSRHDFTVESLRRGQILCVDEGHNFVNIKSNRTQRLFGNMADHVLLFTATPINRSVTDLLRIADLLGADNLEPSTLEAFKKMLSARNLNRSLTEPELDLLRKEINRFTVRRTKQVLNGLVMREPERYMNRMGDPCRYPRHEPKTYKLDEFSKDRRLAERIAGLAEQLHAVLFFEKPIELPESLRKAGVTEDRYLAGRLSSAKKIARYLIMASLRSSRAALIEHLEGTAVAKREFGLDGFRKNNPLPGVFDRLARLPGRLPVNRLSIPLPGWLSDEQAHREACLADTAIYREIVELVRQMSDRREQRKAELLLTLLGKHDLLLAFDSRPITLGWLQALIAKRRPKTKVMVATGDASSDKRSVLEVFRLGSGEKRVIGLCSDSLSEGVNLQQASALVHLDMPSVVRIAEQRVGRVDRMDSPHKTIQAWWPDDAPEFQLSSDERFVERYETVENLLGSNMPLPENLKSEQGRRLSARDLIAEYEREAGTMRWDGIEDAFESVRALVGGDRPLIDAELYARYHGVAARVLSRVSLVEAQGPWAFFCIAAGTYGAPRWLLLPSLGGAPLHELPEVSAALRERLHDGVDDLNMSPAAESLLTHFIRRISEAERSLLSRRKQRALDEMEQVLGAWLRKASRATDQRKLDHLQQLLDAMRRPIPERQPDWDELAVRWLDLIRPIWYEKLKTRKPSKPLLLADIRKDLIAAEAVLEPQVEQVFTRFPVMDAPDRRIIACVLGVA